MGVAVSSPEEEKSKQTAVTKMETERLVDMNKGLVILLKLKCKMGRGRPMNRSTWDTFLKAVSTHGHKTALVFLGTGYTYSELLGLSERLAGALHGLGVRKGDRVIIYLPHCPQWVIAWLALQRLGAVAVPVTHFYGEHDLRYIAQDSGSRIAFASEGNIHNIRGLLGEGILEKLIFVNTADHCPWWKKYTDESVRKARVVEVPPEVLLFDRLLEEGGEAPQGEVGEDDVMEILYTSGTTGLPKGVPFTHKVFVACSIAERNIVAKVVPQGKAVILQGSPLYHILGQKQGLAGLFFGDTIVLLPRMDVEEVLRHIERYRVTNLFGTPTFYRMILEHPAVRDYDLGSLRWCFSGGDYLPPVLIKRWMERTKTYIYQGLGATETCGAITMTPGDEEIPEGSLGRVLPEWEVKLVDPDTGEELPVPGQGELLVTSQYMIEGYWRKPEETERSFIRRDGKVWYRTGDIVRIDEDGWVYFLDRSGDIIKHKGYRVVPSKVERVLNEHPAVASACVVGIPDQEVGEKIKALVVLNKGAEATPEELIQWAKERLSPYEVPHWIEFRESLPTSPSGKILRRVVRTEERKKLGLA